MIKKWGNNQILRNYLVIFLINLWCGFVMSADMEPPILTCLNQSSPIYDNATSKNTSWSLPHTWDNSGMALEVACSADNPTEFTLGRTYVSCNATDLYGNVDSCGFEMFMYSKSC